MCDGKTPITTGEKVLRLLVPSGHIVLHAYVVSTTLAYVACNNNIALWRRNRTLPHIRLTTARTRRALEQSGDPSIRVTVFFATFSLDEGFQQTLIIDKCTGILDC